MDDHLDFEYGANTEVYDSCGASLHGEMFVIGGWNERFGTTGLARQVCIINQLKSRHLSADGNNDIEP